MNARRVKIDTLKQCMIDLKPNRKENEVYINSDLDVTELVRYIDECKKKRDSYTYFHAFLTTIGKVMHNCPFLNRYIVNRHMYENSEVLLSFAAKVSFDDNAGELMLVVPIEENDNIESISRKTAEMVDKIRNAKEEKPAQTASQMYWANFPISSGSRSWR